MKNAHFKDRSYFLTPSPEGEIKNERAKKLASMKINTEGEGEATTLNADYVT